MTPSENTPFAGDGTFATVTDPDALLHIYYLRGTLPRSVGIDKADFLGNWEEDGFSFLFFLSPAPGKVAQLVDSHADLELLDTYTMSYRDWQGGEVGSHRVGSFLLIPPWEKCQPGEGEIPLILDSGVVFGNGTHPTTSDCLNFIEFVCSTKGVNTMLDLGTGTGILALAGAKLGCRKVAAIDFNYLACRTATANVRLNGLEDKILVFNGQAQEHLHTNSDLLVANIHYAVMKELLDSPGFLKQKWFILSGLLNSEAEKVHARLKCLPVSLLKHENRNGIWNTFLGITNCD